MIFILKTFYLLIRIIFKRLILYLYMDKDILNSFYQCFRCNYKTNRKSIIKQHINKKNKCIKNINYYFIPDDIINTCSLLIQSKNNNHNNFICGNCHKHFSSNYNLQRHYKKCIENNKKNKELLNKYKLSNNEHLNEYIKEICNLSISQYFNKPIFINSFYQNWNTNNIDILSKKLLFISNDKYSDILRKILEDNKNINVLFNKNEEYGYVINNKFEIEIIHKNKLVEETMRKIYKLLKQFKDELKEKDKSFDQVLISKEDEIIYDKYLLFQKSKDIYHKVQTIILNIYHEKFIQNQNTILYILLNKNIGF